MDIICGRQNKIEHRMIADLKNLEEKLNMSEVLHQVLHGLGYIHSKNYGKFIIGTHLVY